MIKMTDDRGRNVMRPAETEPEPASVVLVNGEYGMAWQRRFDDGLWHPVGNAGRGRTWSRMLEYRNMVLVYEANVRAPANQTAGV